MSQKQELCRKASKTNEGHFLRILEQEFNLVPRIAQAVLEEAQKILQSNEDLKSGQIRRYLAKREAGGGRSLKETPTVEVIWTVDGGKEDQTTRQAHGRVGLRRFRIQRLVSEALEQGGVATQEDLSDVLDVSIRTIKQDCQALESQGLMITTRGKLHGIGRGQTHKSQIVGQWLKGGTYDQIMQRTHHSTASIQRYVKKFVRIVDLYQRDFDRIDIAHLTQTSEPLVQEYLAIYESHDEPICRERLTTHLNRLRKGQRLAQEAEKGGL